MANAVTYSYRCKLVCWLDGDTADLDVDLGFYLTARKRVRLAGIDCPELHSRDPLVKAAGQRARAFSESLAPVGAIVFVRTYRDAEQEKYGRWLARMVGPNCPDVTEALLAAGHGLPYDGGKRT